MFFFLGEIQAVRAKNGGGNLFRTNRVAIGHGDKHFPSRPGENILPLNPLDQVFVHFLDMPLQTSPESIRCQNEIFSGHGLAYHCYAESR